MDDKERRKGLADFLRTRRTRLSPPDVNLPWGSRRRTPGLRREEVAQLANMGTSWYVALEQGRNVHPSEQVLESLTQALCLNEAERHHLFLLARPQSVTNPAPAEDIVGNTLRQAVNALNPHPVYVLGRRWDLLTWNKSAELVFSFSEIEPPHSRNLLWRSFTSPVLRKHQNWEQLGKSLIAQFRADSARYPGDKSFEELIEDLNKISSEFRLWWSNHDVKYVPDGHKIIAHPVLGHLEFEYLSLQVTTNHDQKMVIYTCSPETSIKLSSMLSQK